MLFCVVNMSQNTYLCCYLKLYITECYRMITISTMEENMLHKRSLCGIFDLCKTNWYFFLSCLIYAIGAVNFKLLSLNVLCIRKLHSRKSVFMWIAKQKADIIFLQEHRAHPK